MPLTMDDDGAILVHLTNPGGIVGGTGAANQIAYWTAGDTIGGDPGLLVDAANDMFIVADGGGIGNAVATARLIFDSSGADDVAYFSSCFLGVGTTSPVCHLNVVDTGGASTRGLAVDQHNDGVQAALFNFRKSRGTEAVPTTVANGDYCGSFYFQNYDGTNFCANASWGYRIAGAVGLNNVPGELFFATSATSDFDPYTLGHVRMVIQTDGLIGIGTIAPSHKLNIETLTDDVAALAINVSGDGGAVQKYNSIRFKWGAGTACEIRGYALNPAGNNRSALAFTTDQGAGVTDERERVRIDWNGRVGIAVTAPLAQLHVDQSSSSAAIPVLYLDQGDVSEPFTNYVGTSAASAANSLSSWTTGNAVQGHIQVDVNGTKRWLRFYDDPTS